MAKWVTITVNGRTKRWYEGSAIDRGVALSLSDVVPLRGRYPEGLVITWKHGDRGGTLGPGDSVAAVEGLAITAMQTGSA